jgi:chloride channel protein, CIC family
MFCQRAFHEMPLQPGTFELVEMAGLFATAANTPISTIMMISDMTGTGAVVAPTSRRESN